MLYIFRQLRRRLLNSSESRRYFIYALGEIALVVIGILIALQINNWNEKKNARQFELTMLTEIRSALKQDRHYVGSHIPYRMSFAENALSFFNRWLLGATTDRDSMDHHFRQVFNSYLVTLNRGPYEALKFTGLDKISNDSLRNHMIHVYDFTYPRYEKFLLYSEDLDRDRQFALYDALRMERTLVFEDEKVSLPNPGIKDIDFKDNQDFLELMAIITSRINNNKNTVDNFVPSIDSLIFRLDREIGDVQ